MKNFFTSMSLAAMSLLAATPTFAQQQQLTATQAEAVVKTVFPAVIEQVKMVSGLDIQALTAGEMDWTLYTPTPAVTVQPDSARVYIAQFLPEKLKGILATIGLESVKVDFNNHQELNANVGGTALKINLPGTTSVDLMGISQAVKVLIEAEQTTDQIATVPFKSLVIKSEINPQLSNILAIVGGKLPEGMSNLLKSGTILTMNQSSSNGVNTVTTEVGEIGQAILAMISEESAQITKTITSTDMTTLGAGYYTVTNKVALPNGSEIVQKTQTVYNPAQTLPLVADSIVTNTYDMTGNVAKIDKEVFLLSSTSGSTVNSISKVNIDSITVLTGETPVYTVEKDSSVMIGNQLPLDHNNITMSIIQSIMTDMAMGNSGSIFTKKDYEYEDGNYKQDSQMDLLMKTINATTTAEKDTLRSEIALYDCENDQLKEKAESVIEIDLTGIQALVKVYNANETLVATFYAKSNLLSIATDNEEIAAPQSDVTFGFEANGIYVNNCKQGRYTIVDMNGRIVANGVIAGEGAYIATPQLTRGKIYVIAVQDEQGLVKAAKFAK